MDHRRQPLGQWRPVHGLVIAARAQPPSRRRVVRLRGPTRWAMLRGNTARPQGPMSDLRIIKKYPNRRLYDTEISSYITIEDVRQLIIDGENFEVRDAKSGQDLTRQVLLQIISEHEQEGQPILSTQLLGQIIRFYGDPLQGFMATYLERSMQVFLDQQTQFRQQVSGLLGQTPWTMMNKLTERNLEMWQDFQKNLVGSVGRAPGTGPDKPDDKRGR